MKQYIALTNSEIEKLISENVHSDRDRGILRLRLIEGWTFERIAEEVGMSPRYIRTLVHRLAAILKIASK